MQVAKLEAGCSVRAPDGGVDVDSLAFSPVTCGTLDLLSEPGAEPHADDRLPGQGHLERPPKRYS